MNKKTKIIVSATLAIILIGAVVTWFMILNSNGETTITGTISKVEDCSTWIGGSQCTWVVDGTSVDWHTGSALDVAKNAGDVEGLKLDQSDIGKSVKIHGEKTGFHHITIYGSSAYYIALLNQSLDVL